ncbi:hypothetical protein RADP37_05016 [Roseomonas mucosa]|uniref:Uncharacterized protein n=1 Tax=Roseomonas mucosa TaxID=207340 RepID=A0A4Y1N0Z0_9PROT|nr:hypothetical protein RADP37_05016 [Roseomonas mucosa]
MSGPYGRLDSFLIAPKIRLLADSLFGKPEQNIEPSFSPSRSHLAEAGAA